MSQAQNTPLNTPQLEAVEHHEGPLLILAGAGSGKTRVITHRLARLVDRGVRPWRMLAVTFTNKAAGEMRERAAKLLDETLASKMWIGTFHATCAKLLRIHAATAGLRSDFTIYDDGDQKTMVTHIMRDLGLSDRVASPRALMHRIDAAKNAGITADQYRGEDFLGEITERVYAEYQKRLRAANAVDFGDLLLETLRLCDETTAAGLNLAERFDHVLVDEFQDTNRVQYLLVHYLTRRTNNLCVVGDDDQSIYRWRGADLGNILGFENDHPGCRTIKLEQNYRSTETILEAANAVIVRNHARKAKQLFTENGVGEPIAYYSAPDERREAEFVARLIRTLTSNEDRVLGDFAILYRTHAQSRALEEALRAADLSYTIIGGTRFFDRAEVKDILAYLRAIANPADEISLSRIVNVPARGIGNTTLAHVRQLALQENLTLADAIRAVAEHQPIANALSLTAAARRKLGEFVRLMDEFRAEVNVGGLAGLAQRILDRTGYQINLTAEGTPEARERNENLAQLVASIEAFEKEAEEPTLNAYLERVSLVASTDGKGRGVSLMTIHAAKGLEFPVVFLTGLEEGTFPHIDRANYQLGSSAFTEELEEERRLAYVAITRARERLVLTNAAHRVRWDRAASSFGNTPLLDAGDPASLRESRFIGDIPVHCIARPAWKGRSSGRTLTTPPPRPRAPWVENRGNGIRVERDHNVPVTPSALSSAGKAGPQEVHVEYDDRPTFRVGQVVRHKQFGTGQVTATSGGADVKVTVRFHVAGTTKTLLGRFLEPA